jgi:hypothetical protein
MKDTPFPVDRLQPLADWLATDAGAELYRLLGMRGHDHLGMAALLSKIPTYYGGAFPMFKDDLDRWTCDQAFAAGPNPELPIDVRRAFALLWQQFAAACDSLAMTRRRSEQQTPAPRPPFHPLRGRRPIIGPGGR